MLKCVMLAWIKILVYCSFSLHIKDLFAATLTSNEEEFLTERPKRKVNEVAGFDINEEDTAKFHIWPSGIIQYYIDDFSFDKVLRDRIRVFLDNVNSLTGLRFLEIPMPPEDDKSRWVFFLNRKGLLGCADHPFKNFTTEGVQRIVLGYHCINTDEDLADVVLSLVGVPPQHNCPDRDKYITVMKENIRPDKLYLFEKLKDSEWIFHDLDYDFLSAGHYGNYKHNFNGSATLVTKKSLRTVTSFNNGKEKGFSYNDILKIKMLYNYISRNREISLKVPECSKLFDPNSKLPQHLAVITKKEIKPRLKPSRYLKESIIETNDSIEDENVDNLSEDNDKISKNDISKDDENNYEETDRQNNSEKDENNDSNKNYSHDNSKHSDQDNDDNDYNNSKENDTDEKENYNKDSKNEKGKEPNENNEQKSDSKTDENSKDIDNIKSLEIYTNNKKKTDSELYKKSEITYKINTLGGDTNKNLNNKLYFTDTTRNQNRVVLALFKKKIDTSKLLGQSDYETGDEGDKKYIHEKNL